MSSPHQEYSESTLYSCSLLHEIKNKHNVAIENSFIIRIIKKIVYHTENRAETLLMEELYGYKDIILSLHSFQVLTPVIEFSISAMVRPPTFSIYLCDESDVTPSVSIKSSTTPV